MQNMKLYVPLILSCLTFFLACNSDSSVPGNSSQANTTQNDSSGKSSTAPTSGIFESYESTDRGIWQKPDLVLSFLGDLSGKSVADIGAGTGFFTKRLIKKADKVIAIDIDQRFIDYLDSLKVREFNTPETGQLEARLASANDPRLQTEEVDVIIIVNTYMYIQNRLDYLQKLKNGLKPGGTLLIIDFKKKQTSVGPPSNIRTPLYQVESELESAQFENISSNDSALDYQYIVLAKK